MDRKTNRHMEEKTKTGRQTDRQTDSRKNNNSKEGKAERQINKKKQNVKWTDRKT
jgi:hypothetical protein